MLSTLAYALLFFGAVLAGNADCEAAGAMISLRDCAPRSVELINMLTWVTATTVRAVGAAFGF